MSQFTTFTSSTDSNAYLFYVSFAGLGTVLGLERAGLSLGLGLGTASLGLRLGFEGAGLGFDLGIVTAALDYNTGLNTRPTRHFHFCQPVCPSHDKHLQLIHTATPDKTKLSCLCRVRFGSVNWIPDNSRLPTTGNLKSEHVKSNCPIAHQTRHRQHCFVVVVSGGRCELGITSLLVFLLAITAACRRSDSM